MRRLKNLSGFAISALIFSLTFTLLIPVFTAPAQAATIRCVKGKSVLTVSGTKPVCPAGYKKSATPVAKASATATSKPAASAKPIAPVNGLGVQVPYLELQVGCYSSTYPISGPVNIEQAFLTKKFYTAQCSKYHWQVFYAQQIKTKDMDPVLLDEDAKPVCFSEYKKKFGVDAPEAISDGAIYLRWFFPDTQALGKEYPRRLICIAHTADSSYTTALVNTKALG